MNKLHQINSYLMNIPPAYDVQIADKTIQSLINRCLGKPYEPYTTEDAKTTMDVAGKILKQFSKSQKDRDSIDFLVNLAKILFDKFQNKEFKNE